jgi:DNA-binding transcriptional MerR regulator
MNHYPIRVVAELTGVPTTTLRAWERRYGILKPSRTAKGHRLYSSDDIDLVKEIVKLLKSNHTISEAIRIINNPELGAATGSENENHWQIYQQRMLKSVESFNEKNLDMTYNEALSVYPIDIVTEQVIVPVLTILGDRWQDREAGIAEEHFFSSFLRNKLGARLHHELHRSRGNRILVACMPGEHHELGLLLFCIAAIGYGYQILYLGADIPFSQLLKVVERTDSAAILLSGTSGGLWNDAIEQELREGIAKINLPLMFGGELSEIYTDRLESMGVHALGADHVTAIEKMERIIPAFNKK